MRRWHLGAIIAIALFAMGCASQPSGSLEITENGTYDVTGYAEVVVNVETGEQDQTEPQDASEPEPEPQAPVDLNLVRVQFDGFSMELPAVMVEGYTEAELMENTCFTFFGESSPTGFSNRLYISFTLDAPANTVYGSYELLGGAPTEDVNGITMAIQHERLVDGHSVKVEYCYAGKLYRLELSYDDYYADLYGDYSEQFYRTIRMD